MKLIKTGIILILIGFAMVFIGTMVSSQKTNIGGLIMIGLLMFFLGRRNETPGKKAFKL